MEALDPVARRLRFLHGACNVELQCNDFVDMEQENGKNSKANSSKEPDIAAARCIRKTTTPSSIKDFGTLLVERQRRSHWLQEIRQRTDAHSDYERFSLEYVLRRRYDTNRGRSPHISVRQYEEMKKAAVWERDVLFKAMQAEADCGRSSYVLQLNGAWTEKTLRTVQEADLFGRAVNYLVTEVFRSQQLRVRCETFSEEHISLRISWDEVEPVPATAGALSTTESRPNTSRTASSPPNPCPLSTSNAVDSDVSGDFTPPCKPNVDLAWMSAASKPLSSSLLSRVSDDQDVVRYAVLEERSHRRTAPVQKAMCSATESDEDIRLEPVERTQEQRGTGIASALLWQRGSSQDDDDDDSEEDNEPRFETIPPVEVTKSFDLRGFQLPRTLEEARTLSNIPLQERQRRSTEQQQQQEHQHQPKEARKKQQQRHIGEEDDDNEYDAADEKEQQINNSDDGGEDDESVIVEHLKQTDDEVRQSIVESMTNNWSQQQRGAY